MNFRSIEWPLLTKADAGRKIRITAVGHSEIDVVPLWQGEIMKKLTLTGWAAAGEIVGTNAVVISLLFFDYSINRNTDATQASSENILFERHTDLANHFMTDPTLAELMVKRRQGVADLSEVEAIPKTRREELHYGFDTDFWEHVGAALFDDVDSGQ